jgi:asparagine synthase (glutamine-hydrolysing)
MQKLEKKFKPTFPGSYESVISFYEKYSPAFMHIRRPSMHSLRQFDFHTYLPGAVLAKVDRMSMQHSLEVRTPFLAPKILAMASQASESACRSGGVQKVVLRKLLSRYLPDEHAYAEKKGFGMPPSVFFNNREKVEAELRTAYHYLRSTKFFADKRQGLDAIFGSVTKNINAIWAVIVLSKWMQSVHRPL